MQPPKRKPDIVDISPTSFGARQLELAKTADVVYNNLIGPTSKRQQQSEAGADIVIDVPDDKGNHIIIDELEEDPVGNHRAKDDLIILQPKELL